MRQIIVERSDWFVLDAKDAVFTNLETNEKIDGEKWLDLDLQERGKWVISSSEAEELSIDGNIEQFDVSEHKEYDLQEILKKAEKILNEESE